MQPKSIMGVTPWVFRKQIPSRKFTREVKEAGLDREVELLYSHTKGLM